jgi:hypothetical protein
VCDIAIMNDSDVMDDDDDDATSGSITETLERLRARLSVAHTSGINATVQED